MIGQARREWRYHRRRCVECASGGYCESGRLLHAAALRRSVRGRLRALLARTHRGMRAARQ